jgi:LPXTG-motif cell wall-anchored protein
MKIIYQVKESTKLKLKQISTALFLTTALVLPFSPIINVEAENGGSPNSNSGQDSKGSSRPSSDQKSNKSADSPSSADSGGSSDSSDSSNDPSNDSQLNAASSRADVKVQPGSSGQASAQASVGGSRASAAGSQQVRIQQSPSGKFSFSPLSGVNLNEVRFELLDPQGSVVDVCSQLINHNVAQACSSNVADGNYVARITVSASRAAEPSVQVMYSSSGSSVVIKDGKASLVGKEAVAKKSKDSKKYKASSSSSSSSSVKSSALPSTGNDYVSNIFVGGAVGMIGLAALSFLKRRRMINADRTKR